MPFAFEKLGGLPRAELLDAVDPILAAHAVAGVELIWRTDQRGRVLHVTVERAGTTDPGAGVTLDECAEISRDLSAALDGLDVLSVAYRLEVGTPGVERQLYALDDYRRFEGQKASIRLTEPLDGTWRLDGRLAGLDGQDVVLQTDRAVMKVDYSRIQVGRLVFDFDAHGMGRVKPGSKAGGSKGRSSAKARTARGVPNNNQPE